MVCIVCERAKKRNAFANGGSSNFRKSALCSHNVSAAHRLAVKDGSAPALPLAPVPTSPGNDEATQLAKLAYFLAKQGIPIRK